MIFNVRNICDAIVTLTEYNVVISPGQTKDLLDEITLHEIQQCESLLRAVTALQLIVNNGDRDLTVIEFSKYLYNQSLGPTDVSGKPRYHETSRPEGTVTCWSARGDDLATADHTKIISYGEPCIVNHRIGEQDSPFYLDFCTMDNTTYLHEGQISYQSCMFDEIECSIVPQLVTYTPGTNTNFQTYNGIIIPAAGDGDVDIDPGHLQVNGGLVQVKYDETGKKTSAGFWNVDWDDANHQFVNLTAAPDGSGDYNMFYFEMVFSRFVIDYLLGNGTSLYQSADTDRLWHGFRLKIKTRTCGLDWQYEGIEDHLWQLACRFTMHRTKIV